MKFTMKYLIPKLTSSFTYLIILGTILSGTTAILTSNKAIAEEVAQLNESKSDQLTKAQEVTQGFFDSLINGQFQESLDYLSPSIQGYSSGEDIQEQWQKVLDDRGAFVEYRRIRAAAIFDTYTVLMTANFENSIADFVVTLDSNQQITAVDFLLIGNIQVKAEEFVDALGNGKYGLARGYLTPQLKETVLPENIEESWLDILAETGAFKQISSSEVVRSPSLSEIVLVNLEFEQEDRSIMILFNPLSEIVGVDFPEESEE